VCAQFISTDKYIAKTLACPSVKIYLDITKNKKPVYLITGIKVARGVTLESKHTRVKGFKASLGLAYPGIPVEGGPEAGVKKTVEEGVSFEGSSDFVIAVRVERIKPGSTEGKLHTRGAKMEDSEGTKSEPSFVREELGPDDVPRSQVMQGREADMEVGENGETTDTVWIVPEFDLV
jgi:hypothetical protein